MQGMSGNQSKFVSGPQKKLRTAALRMPVRPAVGDGLLCHVGAEFTCADMPQHCSSRRDCHSVVLECGCQVAHGTFHAKMVPYLMGRNVCGEQRCQQSRSQHTLRSGGHKASVLAEVRKPGPSGRRHWRHAATAYAARRSTLQAFGCFRRKVTQPPRLLGLLHRRMLPRCACN